MNPRLKLITLALATVTFAFSGIASAAPTPPAESEAQLLEVIRQHPGLVKYINDHPDLRKPEYRTVDSPLKRYGGELNLTRAGHLVAVYDPSVCEGFAITVKNDGGAALAKTTLFVRYDGSAIHDLDVAPLEPNESKRVVDRNTSGFKSYVVFTRPDLRELARGEYRSCLR